ncbi:MAG: hypothetical protein ABIH59_01910 [archaeon]
MNIKTKKQNEDGIVRLETSGEIKEIIMNEDFLKPKEAKVSLCFRGKNSSGVVELNMKEAELIQKDLAKRLNFLVETKVLKFEK